MPRTLFRRPIPGRPTVTPATLTPVGYLQFENGFLQARHSSEFSDRLGMNEVIRLTVTPRLQLLLETEPVVRSTAGGGSRFHSGGIAAGLQGVLVPGHDSRPTIAVSYHHSLYNGAAPDMDLAFLPAIARRQCSRGSLGNLLSDTAQHCRGCRLQSWADPYVHTLGDLRRLYVPAAHRLWKTKGTQ